VSEEKEKKFYEINSKFIITHIREIGIGYWATIFYVSGKDKINLTLFYDYICNVLFRFDLIYKPNKENLDYYFIHVGYDCNTKLNDSDWT
jgi:hypothetical protein